LSLWLQHDAGDENENVQRLKFHPHPRPFSCCDCASDVLFGGLDGGGRLEASEFLEGSVQFLADRLVLLLLAEEFVFQSVDFFL